MKMMAWPSMTSCLFAAQLVLSAAAQANEPDRRPSTVDPKACSPHERLEQGPRGPEPPATTGRDESAADKLARTEGVICPPDVDPQMKVPTPEGGRTPVIPPPGTPGGDPTLRPK
jgi:hypothetical protein